MTYQTVRNAFFQVSNADYVDKESAIRPEHIMGITVTEELYKSVQGSINLVDPYLVYAKVLRHNSQVDLRWGYKAQGEASSASGGQADVDSFLAGKVRRGIKAYVINPSGNAGSDGVAYYSCGFMSLGWFKDPKYRSFNSGTKRTVLETVFREIGATSTFIMFDSMNQAYTEESVERQSESNFAYLARLSSEWRCILYVGYAQDGTVYGVFCDSKSVPQVQALLAAKLGVAWAPHEITWKTGNVKTDCLEYSWGNQEGENGQGDNVQMTMVDGKVQIQRFTVRGENVVVWTMDAAAVDRWAKDHPDIKDLSPIMDSQNFHDEVIQQFWSQATQTTAPNGLGYTIHVKTLGNPLISPGMIVRFGGGFPSCLSRYESGDTIQFIVQKASHSFGMNGYYTDLEVVDIMSVSAVGVR